MKKGNKRRKSYKKNKSLSIINVSFISEIGISHKIKGVSCQDSISIYRKNNIISLVASDGAGSSLFAKEAADATVNYMGKYVCENYDNVLNIANEETCEKKERKRICMTGWANEIYCQASYGKTEKDVCQYYATLIEIVKKGNQVLFLHQGDGLIGMLDNENNLSLVSGPDNGEYANTTYFITDASAFSHLSIYSFDFKSLDGVVFFLMTDGVEKCYFSRSTKKYISQENLIWLAKCSLILPRQLMDKLLRKVIKEQICLYSNDDLSIGFLSICSDNVLNDLLNIPEHLRVKRALRRVQLFLLKQYNALKYNRHVLYNIDYVYYVALRDAGIIQLLKEL